jgi:predicted RNA binding protein YcfA (HicA-like mRNA interferase family)
MKVRELVRLLVENGWRYAGSEGSHHHYKHPKRRGKLTVPGNPNKEIKIAILNQILKQAGLK